MLRRLEISNFILIEKQIVEFEEGFNAITGETGAGKSSLLGALAFVLGERVTTAVIREGEEKARVTALVEGLTRPMQHLLEEAGVDVEEGEDIILSREMNANGKSRIYINQQVVTLSFLKEFAGRLLSRVGQHSLYLLKSRSQLRSILDQTGNLAPLIGEYQALFYEVKTEQEEIQELKRLSSERLREEETARRTIEEIEEVSPKPDEEETLYEEFQALQHFEEIRESKALCSELLLENSQAVLPSLRSLEGALEKLSSIQPKYSELLESVRSSHIELQEVADMLSRDTPAHAEDPSRLTFLDERLRKIHLLKKKYGPEMRDVLQLLESTKQRLQNLENLDGEIEEREEKLKSTLNELDGKAAALTKARLSAGKSLAKRLQKSLQELNLKGAKVRVDLQKEERSSFGEDQVEFYLQFNAGEKEAALTKEVSGGELSRILFALHEIFSEMEQITTLIFDEIDASIGGVTATIFGSKLAAMGERAQIIAVTHFPQVASHASVHFQVTKSGTKGRTTSQITRLTSKGRDLELTRMRGGEIAPV